MAGFCILGELRVYPKEREREEETDVKNENPRSDRNYISSYRKTVYIRKNLPKRFVGKQRVSYQPCVHDSNTHVLRNQQFHPRK